MRLPDRGGVNIVTGQDSVSEDPPRLSSERRVSESSRALLAIALLIGENLHYVTVL